MSDQNKILFSSWMLMTNRGSIDEFQGSPK